MSITKKILKNFGMENCTSMHTTVTFEPVNPRIYEILTVLVTSETFMAIWFNQRVKCNCIWNCMIRHFYLAFWFSSLNEIYRHSLWGQVNCYKAIDWEHFLCSLKYKQIHLITRNLQKLDVNWNNLIYASSDVKLRMLEETIIERSLMFIRCKWRSIG